ncbi:MAG: hypothetical protein CSA26_05895 [Desulfobacterales bacterium]|nr:MAG: hypothetical protein CSA26_05895 [Desulfobacterales bacterium]
MSLRFISDNQSIPLVLEVSWLGDDLNISLSGGDRGHIGAVALAQARPGLADSTEIRASTSVITVCGHKEDRIACEIAERVAVEINGIVSVACGIHVTDATRDQIESILVSARLLTDRLLQHIKTLHISTSS